MKKVLAGLATAALLVFGGTSYAGGVHGAACAAHGKAGQKGQGATHGQAGQAHGKKCDQHGHAGGGGDDGDGSGD